MSRYDAIVQPTEEAAVFRAQVLERLRAGFDDMVERMFEEILDQVPEFRITHAPGEPADLQSAVRRAAGFFLVVLADDRRLRDSERVALHLIGAQRARLGLSREALTAGVQVALRIGYGHLLDCAIGVTGSADAAVRAMGRLSLRLFDFVHEATSALAAGYLEEVEQRLTVRVREQAALVDRLLEGSWIDDDEIRNHAKLLGHDVGPPCALLIVTGGTGQESVGLRDLATAITEAVPGAVEGPTRSAPVPHVVVLVPAPEDSAWAAAQERADEVAARGGLFVVAAGPVDHLGSLYAVYRRAQRDMVFVRAARGGPGVVAMKDLKAYRILAGAPLEDRLDFVQQILGPLLGLSEHKAVELLDTLEALYDNRGSVAEVAAELGIHEKTVRYRLKRVQDLTGLSVDVPGDRLQLDIAVRLRRLAMAEVSPFDDPAWGPPSARRR
ncbi:MAG TPA: helix-turn-helix domain-containing protein [Acidimicrobiales bacterium]|nr:helix-turn-helix domain-containing protein [Acidimicrobiales bacterium]